MTPCTLVDRSRHTPPVALAAVLLLASCRSVPARAPETLPAPGATGEQPDGSAANPPEVPVDRQAIAAAAAATNRFAFDLYSRLRSRPGDEQAENLIVSPLSAEIALAMTAMGARGTTRTQMEHVLHLDEIADPHHAFSELMASLNRRNELDGMQLHTADRVWGQRGLRFEADFVRFVADHYGAPMGLVDFAHDRDAARTAINDWAAAETNQRIKNLLLPSDLVPAPILVLANAVYFRGTWQFPFDARATRPERFVASAGVIEADMMWQRKWLPYAHVGGLQAVELPYRGGLTMLIVLSASKPGPNKSIMHPGGAGPRRRSRTTTRPVAFNLWLVTLRDVAEARLPSAGLGARRAAHDPARRRAARRLRRRPRLSRPFVALRRPSGASRHRLPPPGRGEDGVPGRPKLPLAGEGRDRVSS